MGNMICIDYLEILNLKAKRDFSRNANYAMLSPHPFALSAPCLRETHPSELRRSETYAKHICVVEIKKVQVAHSYVRGVGGFLQ